MSNRTRRLAAICALTAFLFQATGETSFAEKTAYTLRLPGAAYAVEDCSVYKLSGDNAQLVATFPHPIDEIRNSYSPLSNFNQTRHIYDCSLSTAVVDEDTVWFALDGNDWDKSMLGGIGFFNTAIGLTGTCHPPTLVNCHIDELRISSRTLYATTYLQGDMTQGRCSGIVSINLDNGAMASFAQTEDVENLPNILTEITSPAPNRHVPQKENLSLGDAFSLNNSTLEEYMIAAFNKELAIIKDVQAKSKQVRESRCELSEKTSHCSLNTVHFISGGIPSGSIIAVGMPGRQFELCPWGSKPEGARDHCLNPKKGMMWLFEDRNYFAKVILEDHRTRYVAPLKGKAGGYVFENLKFLLQEYNYPPVETPERAVGLVIDRASLLSKSDLPAELNELFSNLVLSEEIDHKAALIKLEQVSHENKMKLLSALILALRVDEYNVRRYAWFALAKLGELAVPSLKRELLSASELAQEGAIVVMRMIGLPHSAEIIPELINMFKNTKGEVSKAAYYTLQKCGPNALVPLIRLFNESDNARLKTEIIEIISELKSPAASLFLKETALDNANNSDIRKTAAKALLYADQSIPLTHETQPIFLLALRYSGIIPDREEERLIAAGAAAVPVLKAALSEEVSAYRATLILERIGSAAKEAAPELRKLVTSSTRSYISEAAISALNSMGEKPGKEALPVLTAQILIPCERDMSGCNDLAMRLLGEMRSGAKPAIPALRKMLYDYRDGMYAASALAMIAPELKDEYYEILVGALDDTVYIEDSETGAMKWMSTGNSINYATIIDAISEFGPGAKDAAPKIERFLSSGRPYEKKAAEKALERINGKDPTRSAGQPSKALQEEYAAKEKEIQDILARVRNATDDSIHLESDALKIIHKVELMAKAGHQGGYDILNEHFRDCSWRRMDAELYEYILQHLYYSDALLPTVMLGLEKLTTPDIYRGCSYFDMTYENIQPRRYAAIHVNSMIKAVARLNLSGYAYKSCRQAVKSQTLDPKTKQDFTQIYYPALSASEKLAADNILK